MSFFSFKDSRHFLLKFDCNVIYQTGSQICQTFYRWATHCSAHPCVCVMYVCSHIWTVAAWVGVYRGQTQTLGCPSQSFLYSPPPFFGGSVTLTLGLTLQARLAALASSQPLLSHPSTHNCSYSCKLPCTAFTGALSAASILHTEPFFQSFIIITVINLLHLIYKHFIWLLYWRNIQVFSTIW